MRNRIFGFVYFVGFFLLATKGASAFGEESLKVRCLKGKCANLGQVSASILSDDEWETEFVADRGTDRFLGQTGALSFKPILRKILVPRNLKPKKLLLRSIMGDVDVTSVDLRYPDGSVIEVVYNRVVRGAIRIRFGSAKAAVVDKVAIVASKPQNNQYKPQLLVYAGSR